MAKTKRIIAPTGPASLVLPDTVSTGDEELLLKVAEQALHGHRSMFDGLSTHEQEIVVQWLAEALVTGQSANPVHDVLWEVDFHRKPVDITTFLTDPQYMGKVASGLGEEDEQSHDQGRAQGLHPRWVEDLQEVFRPGSPYTEWILCLSGDTRVPLQDGRVETLAALHQQWLETRQPFGVYSFDGSGHAIVLGECVSVHKYDPDQLYRLELADGTLVRANARHEFVDEYGTKRQVCELRTGDRLMSWPAGGDPACVQSVTRDVREPVYCLRVPAYGNFVVVTDEVNRRGLVSGNTGAIGTGKTTLAMLALAYKLYWLSCLRNPQLYYGLMADSLMVFGIYSITKKQVGDTGYYKLRGWIDSSPYFRHHFPRSKKIDSNIVFTKQDLRVVPGCVAAGTRIATPGGSVPIEDLPRGGGVVLSAVDSVSTVRYSQVVDAGLKRCLDLECENGTDVTVSESHRIEVVRHGTRTFIEAQDIQPGERVLCVSHSEADQRVLSSARQTTTAMQGVCEAAEQRALPRHRGVRGQEARSSARQAEAMFEVPQEEAAGGVSSEGGPSSWRDKDVLAFLVQGLRVDGCQALVLGEHGAKAPVRQEAAFHVSAQTTREETLEAVLRGEQRYDLGAYVVARRPFQTGCAEVAAAGYAYAVGCRAGAGVLWRKVLLLWPRPFPANLNARPCDSVEPGRRYDTGAYGTCVPGVQCVEARADGRGVLPYPVTRVCVAPEGDRGAVAHSALSSVRIVAVRPAGMRRCYDIVEAGPRRSFFANGLSVGNSTDFHAIGLDLYSFCLSGGHHVWTEEGPTPITDLLTRCQRVWTRGVDGRVFLTEPLNAECTGRAQVIPVALSTGQRLEATAHHRWRVLRGGREQWVRTDGLRVGEKVVCAGPDAGDHVDVLAAAVHPLAEVVDIGPLGVWQPVYDVVEVPGTHCFFTGCEATQNPVLCHNSVDEVNFMRAKLDKAAGKMVGQAYDLYHATYSRITSRFIRPGGTVPGIMLLVSSKNAQTSFLEELLKTRREQGMPHTYVSDYPLWAVKPAHKWRLPWFRVEVGDRIAKSRILSDTNSQALRSYYGGQVTEAQAVKTKVDPDAVGGDRPRPGAQVVHVPGELFPIFDEDVDQGLREEAGIATFNVSPLIRDRVSIIEARRDDIPNPFSCDEVVLTIDDDTMLEDYFKIDIAAKVVDGKWTPRLNPGALRFAHVDLGLTGDAAGFAMGHVSGLLTHERVNSDGTRSRLESPFIVLDLMMRIVSASGSQIDFGKIRAFLGYLKRIYPLVKTTLDGWQSVDFMQIIKKPPLRLESAVQSVDKTEDPYLSLRSAHFERRIGMYPYEPYEDEVLDLQRHKRINSEKWKVDHPEKATKGGKGRKDVADCVAGVVWGLITDKENRFVRGAPLIDPEVRAQMDQPAKRAVDPQDVSKAPSGVKVVAGVKIDMGKLRKNVAKRPPPT